MELSFSACYNIDNDYHYQYYNMPLLCSEYRKECFYVNYTEEENAFLRNSACHFMFYLNLRGNTLSNASTDV